MSRTYHQGERRIRVRGVRRDATDLRRLARALIELAQAQTEAEAKAQHEQGEPHNKTPKVPAKTPGRSDNRKAA
jgi:hypothetical protein